MLSFRPAHARESNGRAYLRVYAPAIFGVLRSNTPHNYYASLQGSLGIAGLEARHLYRTKASFGPDTLYCNGIFICNPSGLQ